MNGDQAVVHLAGASAPLPLHAGRLVPLLGGAGLVDQANDPELAARGAGRGHVIAHHAALKLIPHPGVIPHVMGQEFLQRADRGPARQGDGFDALARQVTHQAAGVGRQVSPRLATRKASGKRLGVQSECRAERSDLLRRHATPPFGWRMASARSGIILEQN